MKKKKRRKAWGERKRENMKIYVGERKRETKGKIHLVTGVYFLTLTAGGTHTAMSREKYTPITGYTPSKLRRKKKKKKRKKKKGRHE